MSAEESSQAKKAKVEVEPTTESTEVGPSPVIISEALAKFLGTGEREMLQSEVLRRVWEYIKVNSLEVSSQLLKSVSPPIVLFLCLNNSLIKSFFRLTV